MASSPRIDELRKKFEENPRRYFAPLANEYRKAGEIEWGARPGEARGKKGPVGAVYRLCPDAAPLVPVPSGDTWESRVTSLRERFAPLWRARRYEELALVAQACAEWDPDDPEPRRWLLRAHPNLGVPVKSSLAQAEAVVRLGRTESGHAAGTLEREGRWFPLADPDAPWEEAARGAEAVPPDAPSVLLFGLGLGHGLAALLERIGPDARIVVVERELTLYRETWQLWGALLQRNLPRLSFHVSRPPADLARDLAGWDAARGVVAVWDRAAAVDPDYYAEVAEALGKRIGAAAAASEPAAAAA